jgi:hypothetical protein
MTLDHPARKRKREPKAAALFVERARRAVVRSLYKAVFRYDDDRPGLSGIGSTPQFGDHPAGHAFFSQNGAENRIERVPKPRRVAHRRRSPASPNFQVDITIFPLMHMLGHFDDERKEVEGLLRKRCQAGIELGNIAELGYQGGETGARLFRFVYHLALAF